LTCWFLEKISNFDKFLNCKINKRLLKKVTKGKRWMPWLSEAMKDVTSCEKLRRGANIRYIRRYPNGATPQVEDLGSRRKSGGEPGELKHLSTRRKRKQK
jgi:dihydroorotase